VRDKLIGTLLPPGGYLGIFVASPLLVFSAAGGSCVTETDDAGKVLYQSCTGVAALPQWVQALLEGAAIAGFVLLLALPIIVAIYLAIQLRRGGRSTFRTPRSRPAPSGYA
jgi:hypothetical protein